MVVSESLVEGASGRQVFKTAFPVRSNGSVSVQVGGNGVPSPTNSNDDISSPASGDGGAVASSGGGENPSRIEGFKKSFPAIQLGPDHRRHFAPGFAVEVEPDMRTGALKSYAEMVAKGMQRLIARGLSTEDVPESGLFQIGCGMDPGELPQSSRPSGEPDLREEINSLYESIQSLADQGNEWACEAVKRYELITGKCWAISEDGQRPTDAEISAALSSNPHKPISKGGTPGDVSE